MYKAIFCVLQKMANMIQKQIITHDGIKWDVLALNCKNIQIKDSRKENTLERKHLSLSFCLYIKASQKFLQPKSSHI